MKLSFLLPLFALALVSSIRAQDKKPADAAPAAAAAPADAALMDKVSYAIGRDIGKDVGENLTRSEVKVNSELLAQGFKDVLDKKPSKYTEDELGAAMQQFQTQMMAQRREAMKAQQLEKLKQDPELSAKAQKNKADGDKFLAENGKRKEVVTTKTGLQYEVLKKAEGPKPIVTDNISVHYKGTLLDGKEFDSSGGATPAKFQLGQVIPGWIEGLQLMNVGSKFKFYIPSDLAYDVFGSGELIGPYATLVFEVDLLSIDKAPQAPQLPQ